MPASTLEGEGTVLTKEDLKLLSFQIDSAQKKTKEFEAKLSGLVSKWDEFISTAKLKFDRIQGHFQRQSEATQGSFRDVHTKVAAVASRVNEHKMGEVALYQTVERHKQIIQELEGRLQQLQKTVSEQQNELARLKRG